MSQARSKNLPKPRRGTWGAPAESVRTDPLQKDKQPSLSDLLHRFADVGDYILLAYDDRARSFAISIIKDHTPHARGIGGTFEEAARKCGEALRNLRQEGRGRRPLLPD